MKKLKTIIDRYGDKAQKLMAIEEMSELTKEICKDFRGKGNKDSIKEEIADVLVMIEQLIIIYEIEPKSVLEIMKEKTERTMKRINESNIND